jgi:hypothetical protein
MGHLVGGDFQGIGRLVFRQHLTMFGKHQAAGRGNGDESYVIIVSQCAEFGIMQYLKVHNT